jgi:FtsP/CotA-like multicopper oxidase with cupredoxin domain
VALSAQRALVEMGENMSGRSTVRVVAVALVAGAAVAWSIAANDGGGGTAAAQGAAAVPTTTVPATPLTPGLAFREPPVVKSTVVRPTYGNPYRALRATLVARNATVKVSGLDVAGAQTYAVKESDRGLLGPTLQVKPGDWVELTLDNKLTIPGLTTPPSPNCPDTGHDAHDATGPPTIGKVGDPQYTNLHFHGMHVTPKRTSPYGDTVVVHLPSGKSRIRFQIPADHDKGTFWYHAHLHHCTNDQVFRGLAGLLLVGDARENLPTRFKNIRTRTLALKDVQVTTKPGSAGGWQMDVNHDWGNPTHRTVNGLVNPLMAGAKGIRPGETQMWRVLNVSAGVWYRIALQDESGKREPLTIVAQDGTSLTRPVTKDAIVIPPAARYDILVRGPASGRRVLKTLPFDQGRLTFPEETLATLDVGGASAPVIALPARMDRAAQKFPARRGTTRKFVFDIDPRPTNAFLATINNQVFDESISSATPTLTRTERWIIENKSTEWHPFHIHQNDFRIVSVKASPAVKAAGLPARLPGVQDVVALPPRISDVEPSRVIIEMPFTDFPGEFVFHCHILDHEDAGMMALVDLRRKPR